MSPNECVNQLDIEEQVMVRFIPANQLKASYDVFGHFYSVEVTPSVVVNCRSVLEIVEKPHVPKTMSAISSQKPDAVFIMMNPGSSQPLVEVRSRFHVGQIHELPVELVPTKPDTTQYQVMRLMHYCQWRHVRVLNLSDLRCSQSPAFFKQFKWLEGQSSFDSHSIFSDRRTNELAMKLTRYRAVPVIRAWGLSSELDSLIERCTSRITRHKSTWGLLKEGSTNKYLHPLPSLQQQKLVWVNRMIEQLRGMPSLGFV